MPEQQTRHTHTVQKAYLKNFATERENGKFLIWRFDKKTEEKKRLSVDLITVENYFYPQEIEDWLANKIEPKGLIALNKIIEYGSISNINSEEKIAIARWMIVQDLRTTDYRNELKQGIKKIGTLIMQRHFLPQDIEENIRLSMESDSIEDLQMIMIKRLQRYAPIIAQNYHWMVIENNTNTLYYTSDNPIVRDNSYLNSMRKIMNHKSLGTGRGYFSKGVEIQIPLNPHLKLMLLNLEPLDDMLREVWSVINKNPQLYPILWRLFPHEDIKKFRMEKLNAEYLNLLNFNEKMSGWANRFIFSKTNDFRITEGLIKRRPEFKSETRNRLEVV